MLGPAHSRAIALFRRAAIVIGPHGGAFANLVFAPRGALVVEFVVAESFNYYCA